MMIVKQSPLRTPKWSVFISLLGATAINFSLGFEPAKGDEKTRLVDEIEKKLKTIILPSIDFSDTRLDEALGVVQRISKEEDKDGKGVTVFIREEGREKFSDVPITLRLSNVPLSEAIRYITSLSQTRYRITPDGIAIHKVPRRNELYTHRYTVPPTISTTGGGNKPGDPFADTRKTKPLSPRLSARQILENAGIIFPPGASAVYNPATSQLIVRNSKDQMELVEVCLNSIKTEVAKQIHLRAKVLLSKDPEALSLPVTARKSATQPKSSAGKKPVGIVRSFDDSKSMKQFLFSDDIEKEVTAARDSEKRKVEIGAESFSLAGILTSTQWQDFLHKSGENPNVNVSDLPGTMVRSGQRTVIAGETVAVGVDPVLGVDHFMIDLNLMSRFLGEDLPEATNQSTHRATIWDGQSVVLAGKPDREHHLLLVVTAQIVDPAGMPIQGSSKNKVKASPRDKDRAKFLEQIAGGWEFTESDWKKQVAVADELALDASRLYDKGDTEGAELKYREALKILPDKPETAARKKAYLEQWFKVLKKME